MLSIQNCCGKDVIVVINHEIRKHLPQGQQIEFTLGSNAVNSLRLIHPNESYKKRNVANIMVETIYELPAFRSDAVLSVHREKIRFDIDGCYDCFFLKSDQFALSLPVYRAVGVEEMKKKFKKARITEILFVEPITDFALHDAVLYLAAVACGAIFGWKYLLAFILAVYLFNLVVDLLMRKVEKGLGKAIKGSASIDEDMLVKLDRWSQSTFIAEYFSNPKRKPVIGKVEK